MVEAPSGQPAPVASTEPEPKTTPRYVRPGTDGMPEYGSVSELQDRRRAYVFADDPDSLNLLIGVLKKYKGIELVASPDDAQFFITYMVKASTESLGRQRSHYLRSQLLVTVPSESRRTRIVWFENETYEETGGLSFSRPNEMNLALHLIKALKKLRGEK
jgi:hypothetical protein